ncbi:16091_t:CDS:2 [Gigaspora margarita]|uniref:16091_t:CDS:1 n=1 Tax=Gigaspora margarita TaxID=4874 RepID=A0ABN7URY2_GIGMA|nr:16091_t:CDS:2 [Gigaspora margarita]
MEIFYLHQNMRVKNNPEADKFKNFLLRIENGTEKTVDNNMIKISDYIGSNLLPE